jgi:hypothetical protein
MRNALKEAAADRPRNALREPVFHALDPLLSAERRAAVIRFLVSVHGPLLRLVEPEPRVLKCR